MEVYPQTFVSGSGDGGFAMRKRHTLSLCTVYTAWFVNSKDCF